MYARNYSRWQMYTDRRTSRYTMESSCSGFRSCRRVLRAKAVEAMVHVLQCLDICLVSRVRITGWMEAWSSCLLVED